MNKHLEGTESALSTIKGNNTSNGRSFSYVAAQKIDIEWRELLGIHDITKNAYGNCSTTIQIRLLPNGDFAMIDIVESSESDKFDDIAFLSILHTNLRDKFNDIPEEKQSELRQFNIVFKYDGVR